MTTNPGHYSYTIKGRLSKQAAFVFGYDFA